MTTGTGEAGANEDTKPTEGEGTKPAEGEGQEGTTKAPDGNVDELPAWARESLTKANSEAAEKRVKLRDAEQRTKDLEEKLSNAKTLDEFNGVVSELKAQNEQLAKELLVSKVATAAGLPPELAEVLKGDTEEELAAHAKKLAKFAIVEEPKNVSGGLDPTSSGDGAYDPRELAKKYNPRKP